MNLLEINKHKKRGIVDTISAEYILETYLNKIWMLGTCQNGQKMSKRDRPHLDKKSLKEIDFNLDSFELF